ncbi:MAG: FAD-dependent oxidoreductase [Candidatus Nanopelagicaceae bacterium]
MKNRDLDLAIVGAGLAGLAAARRASELGLAVEVFEASDGIGGRVRSDVVDGYICDRGFQLINPNYPALAKYFQPQEFHRLERSIDVLIGSKSYRLGDPREGFASIPGNLASETGTIFEKVRFLRYLSGISRNGERSEGESFEDEMLQRGIGTFYSKVIGPFASGVFLNQPSRVSATVARELIGYFMIGTPGLPQGGVGEVAKSMASGITVNLRSRVDEIGEDFIRVGRRKVKARAVIVATDPQSARNLVDIDGKVSSRFNSTMSGSTTWYHSSEDQDFPSVLRLDGGGDGPITNTIAISSLAPEYAPSGRTLISTTVMSAYGNEVTEARVRTHLAHLWRKDTSKWRLVAKYSIPKSLPLMSPGFQSEEVIDFTPRTKRRNSSMLRYLAGDFLVLPAQQGAVHSGVKAAEMVATNL